MQKVLFFIFIFTFVGCGTKEEVVSLEASINNLDREIGYLQSDINKLEKKIFQIQRTQESKFEALESKVYKIAVCMGSEHLAPCQNLQYD